MPSDLEEQGEHWEQGTLSTEHEEEEDHRGEQATMPPDLRRKGSTGSRARNRRRREGSWGGARGAGRASWPDRRACPMASSLIAIVLGGADAVTAMPISRVESMPPNSINHFDAVDLIIYVRGYVKLILEVINLYCFFQDSTKNIVVLSYSSCSFQNYINFFVTCYTRNLKFLRLPLCSSCTTRLHSVLINYSAPETEPPPSTCAKHRRAKRSFVQISRSPRSQNPSPPWPRPLNSSRRNQLVPSPPPTSPRFRWRRCASSRECPGRPLASSWLRLSGGVLMRRRSWRRPSPALLSR
jgi:hypothetical protein